MKKIYFLLFTGFLFAACSDDDSPVAAVEDNDVSTADYLPLDNTNYWVYDVESPQQQGRDSLYITGDVSMNGNTYKKFTTLNLPFGLFSNAVYNDGIRKQGDKLLLTGNAEFGVSDQLSLTIPINDFVILKENAAPDQQLATTSGSVIQPADGYNLKFDYILTTRNKQDLATYTVGTHTYSTVKKVETVLNLKVTGLFEVEGFGTVPVTVMNPQNVVVSTQYYADGIGVVHVSTDVNYTLENLSMFSQELPIPQSASEHQEEILDHYSVE
jgi:hypothetical protein